MIIAAIYPVLLWLLVFRFRRTWPGFMLVVVGTLMVWPVAQFVANRTGPTGVVVANLVYGEMTLIGLVSLWLASMRRPPSYPMCPYCRYDLTGLPVDAPDALCPECGQELNPSPTRALEPFCMCCGRVLKGLDFNATGQTCPGCGAGEDEFGNWKRARTVLARAQTARTRARRGKAG